LHPARWFFPPHPQLCNPLKVTAVVGEEGQGVVQGGGSNEQLKVAMMRENSQRVLSW